MHVSRELFQRYLRLSDLKNNDDARECPKCNTMQIGVRSRCFMHSPYSMHIWP